ncbi:MULTISPECIES: FHA domain-containing protein [Kocuria]|uniref:FHA domain-containing protein n=1 Tax=Kocuria TaxID=57493 RepID=UPI0006611C4C|nr:MULTISPECIES: FHA domain-containing protein [Kocuria]MCT1367792.1 FHA domain-containing protein [Rothia sp. p3-SID1597]RUQ20464.1 FHA domain-containing protein [Kocuria sp. HSID16901]
MSDHHDPSPDTTVFGLAAASPGVRPQRKLAEEEIAAIKALPAESALLIAQEGPQHSARFLLDASMAQGGASNEGIVAGRHPDADIFLDDVTVSRHHAVFQFNAGRFDLTDAGSLNGTYINGDRVDHVTLKSGDEVRIGKFAFVYYSSDAQ